MAEDSFRVVEASKLRNCVSGIFRWKGMPDADANITADTAVDADLRGVHSHGVLRVDPYLALIDKGEFVAKPNIRIVRDLGPRAVVDGDGGMGQVSGYRAMELAIQRTREHGIASVSLRNGRHIGAAAYYSMMASAQGMIGVTVTNAGINMVPTGGTTKLVGNNPLAIAVPTNREFPMVLDVATSVAAGGKLDVAISKGEKIPLGWALDPDGVPTDDPVIAREGISSTGWRPQGIRFGSDARRTRRSVVRRKIRFLSRRGRLKPAVHRNRNRRSHAAERVQVADGRAHRSVAL